MGDRLAFSRQHIIGTVLNIGVGDGPGGITEMPTTTNFDLDRYEHPRFVQGDAHRLTEYFPEKSFDTVLLADCLEHMVDPEKALIEASKVARRRIVITAPWDNRYPTGQHIEAARVEQETPQAKIALQQWYDWQKQYQGKFREKFPELESEGGFSHGPTINTLSDEWLRSMIAKTGWKITVWEFFPEGETGYSNWGICLEPPVEGLDCLEPA